MKKSAWALLLVGGALILLPLSGSSSRAARLADAIATAEGFYVPGSRPQRDRNPGDLTKDFGFPTAGMDGQFVIFLTIEDGWAALQKQTQMMLDGSSQYYNPQMTIRQMAQQYTATEQDAWAQNVASRLGVTVDTPLSQV